MNEFLKLEHTTEIADLEQLPGSSSILKLKFKKVFPSIHIFLFKTSGSTELVFTDYIRYMVQDGKSVIAGNGKDHYPYLTRPNVSGGDPRVSYQLPWWKLTFDSSYELIVITGWDLLNTTDEASGAKIQRFSFTTDKYLLTEPDVYLFQDKSKIKMNQNDIYQCYTVERQDNDKSLEKRATLFVGYNNFNRVEGDFTSNLSSILGREVKLHVVREVEYTTATNQVVKIVTKTGTIGNIGNFKGYKVDRDNVSKDTDGLLDGVINDLPKDRATFPFKVRLRIFLSVKTDGSDDQVDSTGDIPTGNGVTELCKPMEFKLNYHYRKSSGQGLMYFSNKIRVTELEEETEYDISSGNLELESITGITPYFELMGYKIDTQAPSIDPSQDFEGKAGTKIVLTIYEFRDGARQSEVKKYTYETRNERDLPKFTLAELAGNTSYQLEFSKEGGMDVKKTFILTIKKKTGEGAVATRYGSGSHDTGLEPNLYVYHPLLGETVFRIPTTFGGFHGNPRVVPTWKVSKHEPWLVGLVIPINGTFGFTKKQKEIFEARFYLIPLTEDGVEDTSNIKILKYPYSDRLVGRAEDPDYGNQRHDTFNASSLAYYKTGYYFGGGSGGVGGITIFFPITELEAGKTYIIYPGFTHMNPDGEIIISDAIDVTKDDLARIGHFKVVEDVLDSVVVKEFRVTENNNPAYDPIKTIFNIKAELLTGSSGISKNGLFIFFAGQTNNYWYWNNTYDNNRSLGIDLGNGEYIYNSISSSGNNGSWLSTIPGAVSYDPGKFMNSPYVVSIVNEDYFISKPGTFITDDTGYYKKNVTTIPTDEPKFNITFTPEGLPLQTSGYGLFILNDNTEAGDRKNKAIEFGAGIMRKDGATTKDFKDILDNVSNKNYGKGNLFVTTTGTLELHNASNDIIFTKPIKTIYSGVGGPYTRISYSELAHLGITSKSDIKTTVKKLVAKFNVRVDVPMMKIKPDGTIVYYTLTGECNYEKSVETALFT
nr:MAG TPA: hypothetical protein [Caudoviricetes sp.]